MKIESQPNLKAMKHTLYTLLAAVAILVIPACSNDEKDLPDVDVQVSISGGVQDPENGDIVVKQGTPLVVDGLEVSPRNGKKATLGLTTYYLNGIPQAQTITVPFSAEFNTSDLEPGQYIFQIKSAVYQVDKSAGFILLTYDLVVEPADPDSGDDTPGSSVVTPSERIIAEQ